MTVDEMMTCYNSGQNLKNFRRKFSKIAPKKVLGGRVQRPVAFQERQPGSVRIFLVSILNKTVFLCHRVLRANKLGCLSVERLYNLV